MPGQEGMRAVRLEAQVLLVRISCDVRPPEDIIDWTVHPLQISDPRGYPQSDLSRHSCRSEAAGCDG